jgi:hypothetical protein
MQPRITIVVPTRERCDTLVWALKTCVTQDYDNLEILVSDNASTDETRDVVESYDDTRIRYINPGRRLGMSEHWEYAFSHVDNGYIGVIGDDDGLLPSAIEDVSRIVAASELPLVWPVQQYFWPTYPDPALANSLIMPLRQASDIREVSSQTSVRSVLQHNDLYPLLPSPYFGIVPAHVFAVLRRRSGLVFHSITPDIYAGFAVAAVCPTYLRSERAYSLAGQSGHSNGASQLSGRGGDDPDSPAAKFNSESTKSFHGDLALAPSIPIVVTEAAMQARDHVGLEVPIDLGHMIADAVRDPLFVLNPPVRPSILTALGDIAAKNDLAENLRQELSHIERKTTYRFLKEAGRSVFFRHPVIDCDPARVANVYTASVFVSTIRPKYESMFLGPIRRAMARLSKIRRSLHAAIMRLQSRSR